MIKRKKKSNKFLKFILVLFAVLVCLKYARLNYFKPIIEEKVSEAIEMPFKIKGNIRLGMAGMYPAISLKDVILDKKNIGSYDISVNPIARSVKIEGYKDKSKLNIDIAYRNNNLSFIGNASDIPYKEISEDIDGNFDLKINLKSLGADEKEIKENLHGNILLLGNKGLLRSSALKLWGADLFTSLLSSIAGKSDKLNLNCAIADIDVDKGIATIKRSSIDTDELSINIKGRVDLPNENIKIKLSPEPKMASLVNLALPVNIEGSLYGPKIGADEKGMVKKIGGAVLTTINPAALAVPLITDAIKGDKKEKGICETYLKK